MRKHCVIAFSLANFCFFRTWREVLSPQGFSYLYYWKQYPGYAALAALLINVLLLTAIFVSGFHLLRKLGGANGEKIGEALLLLVFLRAVNDIRAQFEILSTLHVKSVIGRAGYVAVVSGFFLLIGWAIKRYGLSRIARGTALTLLIWSPFGVLGFAQATWWAVKFGREASRERARESGLKTYDVARPRVVWVIFDEMDEHISFAARPAGLSLPAFDRLRAESLVATNAYPPAGHTSQSLPALLTGQLIAGVKPTNPGELLLTLPANGVTVNWSEQRDVFTDARALGFDSSLVGWYHPYCRVIGHHLTNCQWEAASQRIDPTRLDLKSNLRRQGSDLLRLLPFSSRIRSWLSAKPRDYQSEHLGDFQKLMSSAEQTVADERFGLVFIHLPVPHPPYIYDRSKETFSVWPEGSYLDNLALADRALGELRQKMEQANIWDRSTIVVSSDHWWRSDYWRSRIFWSAADQSISEAKDHRVPFIVKLAGQKQITRYEASFNTVLTHDLVLEILKGGASDQSQLTQWLNSHRTIGESPYQNYEDTE